MTIYQEAHSKIDRLPEETVILMIQLMDKMNVSTATDKSKKRKQFLQTAGCIDIDGKAVNNLREASMI